MGLEEEIEDLREEIAETPYNKSTESHIGRLKAKLAEKKEKLENQSSAGGGEGYHVEKHGDATVAFVGFPSVGKSTLLNSLTAAESGRRLRVHDAQRQPRHVAVQRREHPTARRAGSHRGRGPRPRRRTGGPVGRARGRPRGVRPLGLRNRPVRAPAEGTLREQDSTRPRAAERQNLEEGQGRHPRHVEC